MLEIKEIQSFYGKSLVINNVNLQIFEGEQVAILGRNGVGKTTLLKSIVGVLPNRKGSIFFDNMEITKKKTFKRSQLGIAYVPQGREIIPSLSVKENLLLGCLEFPKIKFEEELEYILGYFPALREHLERKGGVLSGGQQQQLAIARALMARPKLLILDEPSEGIQPNVVAEISSILNSISKKTGLALLIVEQNIDFVKKLTTRYYIMEKGRIVTENEFTEENLEEVKRYLKL